MPPTAGLKQETFMFHSSGVWKSEIRVPAWSGSGKSSIPGFFEWKRKRKKTSYLLSLIIRALIPLWGFSGGSVVKNMPANSGDAGSIPELGRFPGGGNGNPLQHSCLGNCMDRGAWWATIHGSHKELDITEQLSMHVIFEILVSMSLSLKINLNFIK